MKFSPDSFMAERQSLQTEGGGSIPTSGLFRKEDWWVRPCDLDRAREIIERHHYSAGCANTAAYCHGLFPQGALWLRDCVGVAWWIPPTKSAAKSAYPKNWNGVLCLSRLAVVPGVPTNACSFLIRHSMRFIDRNRWPMLLTYADEWRGHEGKIYLAAGFTPAGWTEPEPCYVKDGRMVSRKSGPKTRTHSEMLALGCECVGKFRKRRFTHLEESDG